MLSLGCMFVETASSDTLAYLFSLFLSFHIRIIHHRNSAGIYDEVAKNEMRLCNLFEGKYQDGDWNLERWACEDNATIKHILYNDDGTRETKKGDNEWLLMTHQWRSVGFIFSKLQKPVSCNSVLWRHTLVYMYLLSLIYS